MPGVFRVDGSLRHLSPASVELLALLVSERPRIVPHEEIALRLRGGPDVDRTYTHQAVKKLRDDLGVREFIAPAAKRGYRWAERPLEGATTEGALSVTAALPTFP
jgi:DNA-binding winged helix-turn-helix (wHTH) protein